MTLLARALWWAVLGVVVAVPLDALHVWSGVISYGERIAGPLDWMAVPLFGAAGVMVGLGHRHLAVPLAVPLARPWTRARRAGALPPTSSAAAWAGSGAFVLAYGSSSFIHPAPVVALLLYVALWLVTVVRVDARARPALVLFSLGAALVGPAVEASLSATGSFSYPDADLLGVPMWLPGIYLNVGAAVHLVDRRLLARRARRLAWQAQPFEA